MESVFAQTYKPVEIIVVDDGSNDGTDELMAKYGDKIRYHWQEAQGVAVARNVASQMVKGEYIAFQDDDDLMAPDRIRQLYKALKTFPAAVLATGDFAVIDPDGKLTGERWLPGELDKRGEPVLLPDGQKAILWPEVPAVPHTTLFRKSYGDQIGWFDTEFKYACSDADFLARLGSLGPIVYLPEVVSYYRRGHAAIWSNEVRAAYSRLQLWTKHLALIDDKKPELRRRLLTRMRGVLERIAKYRKKRHELDNVLVENIYLMAMSLLGPSDRLRYKWNVFAKEPLRNLLRKAR